MFGYMGNWNRWGWPHGPVMGEYGGFMPQQGPMMGGGSYGGRQDIPMPKMPGQNWETPMPKLPGNLPASQFEPMPTQTRLDQLRQRMSDMPSSQWHQGDMYGRLGNLWQRRP